MKSFFLIRLLAAALLLLTPASAGLIASDDFDSYPSGALAGQGGAGLGWSGGWTAGSLTGVNTEVSDTSGTGALDFAPAGGSWVSGGARAVDFYPPAGGGTAGKTGIAITRALSVPQTGTFYARFAITWRSGNFNTNDTIALHLTDSAADADKGFNFGYRGLPTTFGVMARNGTASPVAGAFSNFTGNSTVRHLLAKLEKASSSNYNKITVWINPGTTSETDLPNGNCQLVADSGVSEISSLNIRVENLKSPDAGANGNDRVTIDSLALATGFGDLLGPAASYHTIRVEAAADGSANSALPAKLLATGATVTGYAIARDAGGAFIANVPTGWTLAEVNGSVVPGDLIPSADDKSAVFTGGGSGNACISALGSAANTVNSGKITVQDAGTTRPFIWVRNSDKNAILAKIAANPWATSVYNRMISRVAAAVTSHQSNRDSFLRQLPIFWNQSPPVFRAIGTTATESEVRGPAESKFNTGVDCAVLYYLTGDEKYARCAADILFNSVQAFVPLPVSTSVANGGWLFQDDLLLEARVTGTQLPIIHDFLYSYLQTHQVYSVPAAGMVAFSETNAQFVFRKFYQTVRDHGQSGSNWSSLMATCMVNNLLALNDAAERAAALQVYLVTGASRQDSLRKDAAKYVREGDIWPESLQYSNGVGENDTFLMVLLERYDPSLSLFNTYPNLAKSLSRASYLRYPNGEQISFGDGHRNTEGQPFTSYEVVYRHARDRGLTDLANLYGPLINGGIAAGAYNRSALDQYADLGRHNEPLQLLWFNPTIPDPGVALEIPRTDVLPFAGVALQRNPSPSNNVINGLMCFVGGAGHIHSHASGMSMELYGIGQVLGAKSGRTSYGAIENENYYRVFAANNTVVVNGASRGEGGWKNFAINTVQVAAMEPQPFQTPVSADHSFTCSTFQDDKGTLAEATQQRTLSIVRTSPTTGYYVDIFRSDSSRPGEFHDYIYRNVADGVALSTSAGALPLTSQPGRFQTDIGDANKQPGWRYFEDTEVSASTAASVTARFTAALPAGQTFMDLHIPGSAGREYSKVTTPKIVEAPGLYDSKRAPALVVRQNGEAWNRPFAVVFEPHLGVAGSVKNVTKIEKNGALVGLKVESFVAGMKIVQYVLSNPGAADTYADSSIGLSFTGRFAVVTDNGDFSGSLYMGQGSRLEYRGLGIVSVTGANTEANANFASGREPMITSNAPVSFISRTQPDISAVSDQSLLMNNISAPIPFTVGDPSVPAGSLAVTASSSNPALIPVDGIALSGTAENRRVVLSPLANLLGTSVIRLSVSNGTETTFTSFTLTVNPSYDISGVMISRPTDTGIKEDGVLESGTAVSALVGTGGADPWVDRCLVFVFQLPDLGPVANPFGTASFAFQYTGKTGTLKPNDLYGLGRRDTPAVNGSDYYGQTSAMDSSDATLLQANVLNNTTVFGRINTDAGGNLALGNYLNAAYQAGKGAGNHVFLRINTTGPKIGINRATLTMSEGGITAGPSETRPVITYTARESNTPPTISKVSAQSLALNAGTGPLAFTVGDSRTDTALLIVTAVSSETWLVPLENIKLGGAGADRTVSITPLTERLGSSTITLTVSDGDLTAVSDFTVTVTGTPLETWRYAYFDDTSNSGDGADGMDPDGDGRLNRDEYVLGSNPNIPDNVPALSITPGSSGPPVLEFIATPAAGPGYAGVTRSYDIESTGDLSDRDSWQKVPGYSEISANGQSVTCEPGFSGIARFYRLRVSLEFR